MTLRTPGGPQTSTASSGVCVVVVGCPHCSQISPGSAVCSVKFVCCVVEALSASLQALSQLPSAAPGSRLDHRQGAGERGGVSLLEEDSCCGVQVGGCVGRLYLGSAVEGMKPPVDGAVVPLWLLTETTESRLLASRSSC